MKKSRRYVTISAYWPATLISGVLTFIAGATNLLPLSRLPFLFRAAGERESRGLVWRQGRDSRVEAGGYFITSTERRTPLRRRGGESKENRKGWWYDVL